MDDSHIGFEQVFAKSFDVFFPTGEDELLYVLAQHIFLKDIQDKKLLLEDAFISLSEKNEIDKYIQEADVTLDFYTRSRKERENFLYQAKIDEMAITLGNVKKEITEVKTTTIKVQKSTSLKVAISVGFFTGVVSSLLVTWVTSKILDSSCKAVPAPQANASPEKSSAININLVSGLAAPGADPRGRFLLTWPELSDRWLLLDDACSPVAGSLPAISPRRVKAPSHHQKLQSLRRVHG